MRLHTPRLSSFALVFVSCFSLLPAPARAADAPPVKVFILAGQSNMVGAGIVDANPKRNDGKGSLEYLVKNKATAAKYKHLVDANGKWVKRDDVSIWYFDRMGRLSVGYGGSAERIGPELGFGDAVGDHFTEPVLLIKIAWGGKSLAVDFRPPSAGPIPYDMGQHFNDAVKKDPRIIGKYYRLVVEHTRDVLANVGKYFPNLAGRKPQLVGFGWHQGWNDRINQQHNDHYEQNMAHFIGDIRRDLGVKKLPVVLAETGMSGHAEKHPRALSLMKAQAAVAQRPEFKGNVAFVGTKDFFRPKEQSPSGQAYHWNTNAETYYLIGEAMGKAMVKLVEGN